MPRTTSPWSVLPAALLCAALPLAGCNVPLPDDPDGGATDMALRRRDLGGDAAALDLGMAQDLGEPTDLGEPSDLGEPVDLGEPADLGVLDDAGPPGAVGVRFAHLIPGGVAETTVVGTSAITLPVRLCIYTYLPPRTAPVATQAPTALPPAPASPGTVSFLPFRAISGAYNTSLFTALDVVYRVRVYTVGPTGIGMDDVACPTYGTTSPPPLIEQDVPGAAVQLGHSYTAVALGLVPGTLGSTPPALPAVCGAAFDTACPGTGVGSRAPALALLDDDVSAPSAGHAKLRVMHGIANGPPVDVCYDPDGPGGTAESAVAANVSYGTASAYLEVPAPLASGALNVHVASATACAGPVIGQLPMPIPAGAIPAGLLAAGATNDVLAGDVITIFGSGRIAVVPDGGTSAGDPARVAFIPWKDRPR